jgi:8-oxo-dGTP diphosphatase
MVIKRSTKEEHAGGLFSLVGGTVENEGFPTNLLERTLKRELFEEVGINIKENVQYERNTTFLAAFLLVVFCLPKKGKGCRFSE